jgi:hypothetical protein
MKTVLGLAMRLSKRCGNLAVNCLYFEVANKTKRRSIQDYFIGCTLHRVDVNVRLITAHYPVTCTLGKSRVWTRPNCVCNR